MPLLRSSTALFSLLVLGTISFAPATAALSVFDGAITSSDEAQGDVQDTDCANLDEGIAGVAGCDTNTSVTDLTEYGGTLEGPDASGYDPALTENTDAREFIQSIVNFALSFLGLVAVVTMIYAGILYVTSRGDEENTSKAKKAISYAAIGIVIILGSYAFVNTILQAGGGGDSNLGDGSATNGTTVTQAGAAFDVRGTLREIEDITEIYLNTYDAYLQNTQEIAYLQAIEMPLIVDVEESDYSINGIVEAVTEWLNGSDSADADGDPTTEQDMWTDEYTLMSQEQIDDYVSELKRGIQNIQAEADPYSETYERAQVLYDYLRSGTTRSSLVDWLAEKTAPTAEAYDLSEVGQSYSSGVFTGEPCSFRAAEDNADDNSGENYRSIGLGATVYNTDVNQIDDNICPLLQDIQTAADNDYTQQVNELVNRMVALGALFDSEEQGFSSGSSLSQIRNGASGTYDQALDVLSSAAETIQASTVRNIVNAMNDFHSSVQNLEFVQVVLQASATAGNAPVIVRFNALGTEDPSGETVNENSIQWDLDGDGSFETQSLNGLSGSEPTGSAVSVTYKEEGTYRARVRVLSSSPNIAAGISTVTIRVDPPRSKIVLDATVGSDTTHLADFREFPYLSVDAYKVTMAEATGGIGFDASQTTDGDDNANGIVLYEWDFGDNFTCSGGKSEDCGQRVTHSYAQAGAYTVSLTVTDSTGVQDRKYFTLYVASPAARITYSTDSGPVGTAFTFDSSASSVDVGQIVSRQWSATLEGRSVALDTTTGTSITQAFDEPGIYTISLTVADNSNKTDTASVTILVESTPPVATFEYTIPSSSEPATILFDATGSYDPDEGDELTYEWNFDGTEGEDYTILEMANLGDELTLQYLKTGEYAVSLTVYDSQEGDLRKSDTTSATIFVDSVLDIDLTIRGDDAKHLNDEGAVEVDFLTSSRNATAIEIDYGDGNTDYSDSISGDGELFTHEYNEAGIFYVTATALDDNGNENKITRRVYIGVGDSPIAVMTVTADGEDIGFGASLTGNVNTQFTFDASDSINVDGSSNNLAYSWNFGDGTTATQNSVTHKFKEHTTYTVTLVVTSKKDSSLSSTTTVQITIEGLAPDINGITITPSNDTLLTPLKINVTVDATDKDGKINYIKAWYFDVDDTAKALGTVISQSTSFTLTINTNGEADELKEYGFAAEVYDDDNNSVSSEDVLSDSEVPTITVTNGPNDNPVAGFTVNKTSVYVGESVNFSSTSYDPDGKVVTYWWDTEGDGFYNNTPETSGSYKYTFTQVHPEGIEVRLQVEDDSGATSESESITIYVDANSDAPDAKFLTNVTGTTIQFVNNSTIDTENGAELAGLYWDFNTAVDTDGNGVKDDDIDSVEEKPDYDYRNFGTYSIKMTVVDSTGQSDSVVQSIELKETAAPTAAFTYDLRDKEATFTNNSSTDTAHNVDARAYIWDFDLDTDSNGDGYSDNDADSTTKNPSFEYQEYGTYDVKLVVEDNYGKSDSVTQTLVVQNPIEAVTALLTSVPQANSLSQILLQTDGADVTFYFNAQGGSESYSYAIDKNIFYDTNGDGVRDNDVDYSSSKAGSWKTPFYKSYGQVVTKLTVTDNETGEKDVSTLQVVFEGSLGSANLLNATPSQLLLLIIGALLTAILGVSMVFRYKPVRTR